MWTESPDPFRPPKSSWSPWWVVLVVAIALPVGLHLSGKQIVFEWPGRQATALERTLQRGSTEVPRSVIAPRAASTVPEPSHRVAPAEVPATPATRQLYLCKGYSGGMFWSSALCSTQRATIDRIVTVPYHYSWDQSEAAGERELRAAASLYGPREHPVVVSSGRNAEAQRSTECAFLKRQIEKIDAAARQPQSGAVQDRLRSERQRARAREAELRC